uniref:Uncharacterized protein n=1 Tax=Arundo donax TaxID=35708 RepID=A0A0A9F1H3_ARUDO
MLPLPLACIAAICAAWCLTVLASAWHVVQQKVLEMMHGIELLGGACCWIDLRETLEMQWNGCDVMNGRT